MNLFAEKQDLVITVNYATPNEHVQRAERNNRVIKERIRASYFRLPFLHLPRILIKYVVSGSTKKLNFFPNKNGVSKYYSPRMILHQEHLDYNRHCTYILGEYVLAHEELEPTNTKATRVLDCSYLHPTTNKQRGHELLYIQTNRVITRRRCTQVPMTPVIINQVR